MPAMSKPQVPRSPVTALGTLVLLEPHYSPGDIMGEGEAYRLNQHLFWRFQKELNSRHAGVKALPEPERVAEIQRLWEKFSRQRQPRQRLTPGKLLVATVLEVARERASGQSEEELTELAASAEIILEAKRRIEASRLEAEGLLEDLGL